MKLTRTFHPIGHGAFYTERFYNEDKCVFTSVFDCGCYECSKKNMSYNKYKQRIETYVDKIFAQNDVIDVLFISHFHTDHINGIDYLLKHYNVKKIFIPILTPEVVLEAVLYNAIKTPSIGVTTSLIHYLQTSNSVVQIQETNDYIGDKYTLNQVDIEGIQGILQSGSILEFKEQWLYVPFNIKKNYLSQITQIEPSFNSAINNNNVDIDALTNIINSKKINYWQDIYRKIWGTKHNTYSMTLYSGELNKKDYITIKWCKSTIISHINFQNCLYMGDFEAKETYPKKNSNFKLLRKYYQKYWNDIGIIQVPHHGSENNYNPKIYNKPRICIISVGKTDKYHHPDNGVITGILHHFCLPVLVTEEQKTKQSFEYNF